MKLLAAGVVLYIVASLALAALAGALVLVLLGPSMPRCEEDAIIVGVGDFNNGRWSTYVCGESR